MEFSYYCSLFAARLSRYTSAYSLVVRYCSESRRHRYRKEEDISTEHIRYLRYFLTKSVYGSTCEAPPPPALGLRTHTHTRLTAVCPGLPGWAGARKVKPIWILLKQETVSGSGISWAICKSASRSRQITMPAPRHSVFTGWMLFLPPNQQRQNTEGSRPTYDYVNSRTISLAVSQAASGLWGVV